MTTFFDSLHCTSHAHCRTCRDKEGGRKWRASLGMTFEDIYEIDFICPFSLVWGDIFKRIILPAKPRVRYKADGSVEIDGKPCVSCAEKRKQRFAELEKKRKEGAK